MKVLKSLMHVGTSLVIGLVVLLLSIQTLSSVHSAASMSLVEQHKEAVSTIASTAFAGVTEWHTETVSTIARGNSSIAVDSSGYPRISYEADGASQNLRYAQWTGSDWEIATVDSVDLGSADTALALDDSGNPHISYAVCNPFSCPPKYAEWTGSSWLVTEDMDGYGSLVIDTNGDPHFSYKHGNVVGMTSLKYAYREAGVWISTTVDIDPISNRSTSLKLDGNEHPHISYYKEDTLKYGYWNGSDWITQVVDSTSAIPFGLGQDTSLALDGSDAPHIVYYDGDNQDLKYAGWDGTNWVTETVDSVGDVGKYASLVLDSNEFPHIIYYDANNQAIKYAHRMGTGWQTNIVEAGIGDGDVTSLTIDSNDRLHLSYYYYGGPTDRALRYAYGDVVLNNDPVNLLISSNNQIYEYTTQGNFIQSFPTEYPGGYPITEYARDIATNGNGNIHVYNGTFSPYMSTYDTVAESWSHLTTSGFNTANNGTYGGIDIFGTTVFATDMSISGDATQGVVAFDTTNGTAQRFADNIEPIDLTIGLNSLLYTLSPGGSPGGRTIHIYNPTTLAFIDSIDLTSIFGWTEHRTIAVDYNGDIFIADWDGEVHHVSSDGQLLATISPTCDWIGSDIHCEFVDIDISQNGEIALGTRFGEVFVTDSSFSTISTFDVGSSEIFVEFATNPTISVDIDINANSEENYINLKSVGLVSVVVFTTDNFDAAEIDPTTLGFGSDAAPALQNRIFVTDIDGDSDLDLKAYFYVSQTGIACTDSEAVLTGQTFDGQSIEGSDFITIISRCP